MAPRPALRYVIGFLCALVVLVVAVSTLTVSSIFAGNAVDDIANRFSTALLVAARGKAQSYFAGPSSQIEALAVESRAPESKIPSDNGATALPNSVYCTSFKTVMITAQYNYSSVDLQFDDASYFRVMSFKTRNMVGCALVSTAHDSPPSTTNADYFYISNYSIVDTGNYLGVVEAVNTTRKNRFNQERYQRLKGILGTSQRSRWTFLEAYGAGAGNSKFNLVVARRIFNSTNDFIGIASIAISIEPLQGFLDGLERTANSQVFAVYNGSLVFASTTGDPSYFQTRQAVGSPIALPSDIGAPPGFTITTLISRGFLQCFTSEDIYDAGVEQSFCVRTASTVPYTPLARVASENQAFVAPQATTSLEIKVDGTSYFAGSEPVRSSSDEFGLAILFFLPTDDVRGDVNRGQNIVIGVAAGVLVLATAISVFVVFKILKPLEAVSTKMDNASRLQIDDVHQDESDMSSIAEISALQASYANMAVAVSSFVKFVPRDVVLDLIASGELCKLGMQSVEATICFADILGFSEICQRVDPEQLASALVVYFEQMSGIIASHAGVVDKYIADGIMTLWNTPCITANHELKATLCALMMNRETSLEPLRSTWDSLGEMLSIRVGVNQGICNAGNIGSSARMSYSCIGDNVNQAARLETLNRQFGTHVLVSQSVATKVQHIFCLRYLIPVQVVGKEDPIHVYEVVGLKQNLNFNDVFEKDDNAALSQSVSRMSQVSLNSGRSAGTAGTNATQHQPAVSERAGAKITTRKMFSKISSLQQATLVVSDIEVDFCQDFSQAAETFAQGDANGCLHLIEVIKNKYPMFFDELHNTNMTTSSSSTTTPGDGNSNNNIDNSNNSGSKNVSNQVKKLVEAINNPKRCTACFTRADASANQLVKSCRHVLTIPDPDIFSFVMRANEK